MKDSGRIHHSFVKGEFSDADIQALHDDMVEASGQLASILGAIRNLKSVQGFAPMFHTPLQVLEDLRRQTKVRYGALRHEFAERVLRPLATEALPQTTYPFLYIHAKIGSLDPTQGMEQYKKGTAYADEHLKDMPNDTLAEVDVPHRWRDEEQKPATVTKLHDLDSRTMVEYWKWLVKREADSVERRSVSDARKARKKVYDKWAKQHAKDTGEELPKFGSREARFYYVGGGYTDRSGKTALPEGVKWE